MRPLPRRDKVRRLGGAFLKLDGREALLRSVELFLNRDNVKQIQLVVTADELEEAKRKYGPHLSFSGVKLIAGGPKWLDQAVAASKALSDDATHVIFHDAARPLVPFSDIDALMEEVQKHDAVTLTAPVRTTLVEVDEGGNPMAYHLPRAFVQLLMPQAFTKARFLEMTRTGREIHASVITLLKGSPLNVRLGGPGDAALAKTLLGLLPKPKIKPPSSPFEERSGEYSCQIQEFEIIVKVRAWREVISPVIQQVTTGPWLSRGHHAGTGFGVTGVFTPSQAAQVAAACRACCGVSKICSMLFCCLTLRQALRKLPTV